MTNNKKKLKKGFTLAELMLAILVISIIMVALAPVITKRVKENIPNDSNYDGKLFLYSAPGTECVAATDGQKAVDCIFTVPDGVDKISAVLVSGGGGGAGAARVEAASEVVTKTVTSSSSATAQTDSIVITDNMKDVRIKYMMGGGGGGSAGAYYEVTDTKLSREICDKYGALYVESKYNGTPYDLCMTKYNVGDPLGPGISPVTTILDTDSGEICMNVNCCWRGTYTSDSTKCTNNYITTGGSATTYSGCNRTLCNYNAAVAACSIYAPGDTNAGDWRLPTGGELKSWSNTGAQALTNGLGIEGMQLCSLNTTVTNSIKCPTVQGLCQGSALHACIPNEIWGSAMTSLYLDKNFVYLSSRKPIEAMSTRCVYRNNKPTFKPNAGGGGGGAPIIENFLIPNNIISENINGRIEFTAGAGGKGSSSVNRSNYNSEAGKDGGRSEILVYSADNILKWGLRVDGRYGAKLTKYENATQNGADSKPRSSCQIYDGTNWISYNCTRAGSTGYSGEVYNDGNLEPTAGNGGECRYETNSTNGGDGGDGVRTEGGIGKGSGAGGGGGTIYIVHDLDTGEPIINEGNGGNGANGAIKITYEQTLQAAGGGAGGGGGFARIIDLAVTPGQQYAVRVGGGGNGGNANNSGQNGGNSWIIIGGTKYEITGGRAGSMGIGQTATSIVSHGNYGTGGIVATEAADIAEESYDGGYGTSGADAKDEFDNLIGSAGGCGGESGIGSAGAIGGMNNCTGGLGINTINATNVSFSRPGNVFDKTEYGEAGAGGGGGGWDRRDTEYINLGNGSSGSEGYVYIFWLKTE